MDRYPLQVEAHRDQILSRWLWLAKWILLIPHYLALLVLWTGSVVLTTVAYLAVLITGRYPNGLYRLLVGIARWNLRVLAYLILLPSRYPPFRLDQGDSEPDPEPDDLRGDLAAPAPHQKSAAGPVTALIAGVLLLFPAAGLGVGGGTLLTIDNARDSSGYVTSPTFHLASATAAMTAENLTITDAGLWARSLGDVGGMKVTATSPTGRPIFVGIASQSAVDAWLTGTAHDEPTGLTDDTARYNRASGALRAVPDPAAQNFWLATATGTTPATLQWRLADGSYAVVVVNTDGSPGVNADVRGAAQVPHLAGLGGTMLGVGIVLGLLAIGLIVAGGTGLGRRHSGLPPTGPGPADPAPRRASPVGTGP